MLLDVSIEKEEDHWLFLSLVGQEAQASDKDSINEDRTTGRARLASAPHPIAARRGIGSSPTAIHPEPPGL